MRIDYGAKGPRRKELAQAVSSELNATVSYLGAPSFAYEVGEYQIDKEGMLEGRDNQELVADLQGLHGFVPESEEYDTSSPELDPIPEGISIPWNAELGGRVSPYSDYDEPPLHGSVEPELEGSDGQGLQMEEPSGITIEIPLEGFTEQTLENLQRLVASKANLLKKAIGADSLEIARTESTLEFPWFPMATGDEVEAYTKLIHGLCDLAKKRKRITAKERHVENEKYAFRVFLIQMGFVGYEYKQARKILLKNLTGNSAFRDNTGGG
jgi:hypothetical protein